MDIILHLGGTWARACTAADLAQYLDDYLVIVSSEGNEEGFRAVYEKAGIPADKVIHDQAAWDTVTNFTHTYRLLISLGVERLFVVTSDFHMPRARAIAKAVWGGRIKELHFIEHPHSSKSAKSDAKYIFIDRLRAIIWRWTGILFYWWHVAKKRNAKLGSGHAWIEIAI